MTRYTKLDGRRSLAKHTVHSHTQPESIPVASPASLEVQPTVSESTPETAPTHGKHNKHNKHKSTDKHQVDSARLSHAAESTEPVASTSAATSPPECHNSAPAPAPAPAADADAEPPTVEKLLKRAKLLKLKAKKAKNEDSKKRFQRMTRDVERQVEQMFGSFEYGAKGQLIRLGVPQSDTMWQSRHKHDDWSAPSSGAHSLGGDGAWGARGGQNNHSTDEQRRMDRRDARREQRAEQRQSKLKCFACRGMGHSAKHCPNALDAQSISLKPDASNAASAMLGRDAVGICFRCGSTEHTLSKCRKRALGNDELPYATCFICHSKGHLSSKCSNNAGRGVYPEGGCCKLCSSVEHLAKDCALALRNEPKNNTRDNQPNWLANQLIVGSTNQNTATRGDEDDLHTLARKRAQVHHQADVDKPAAKKLRSEPKIVSF